MVNRLEITHVEQDKGNHYRCKIIIYYALSSTRGNKIYSHKKKHFSKSISFNCHITDEQCMMHMRKEKSAETTKKTQSI